MKALLLFGLLIVTGGSFISATSKNNLRDISRDETFQKSLNQILSLSTSIQTANDAQLKEEFRNLANSIAILKENYADLNSPAAAGTTIQVAIDRLANEKGNVLHGDTCLKDLIRAVYGCIITCSNHEVLRNCLKTAYENYQVCKAGGPRR
ncbi:MAG TPA: hypothetical protein VEV87_03010 [Chitinophagaceae bacterium]|nr:hypothetical protein [Chitinophagaceae bacterium]